MEKNYELILTDDAEWQTLKSALCCYLFTTSCFEVLKSEYIICSALLERIGVIPFRNLYYHHGSDGF